ncbi:hypothetical protein BGY98DRAFT_470796 [Russula aff. rugulosa BPL654]|nr:hypothetical protein BGY98DRAFT_470796 [Russula aff. rugulosa BPL654]
MVHPPSERRSERPRRGHHSSLYSGQPATAPQWQPAPSASFAWSQKSPTTELLATTGDLLRVFECTSDAPTVASPFVG